MKKIVLTGGTYAGKSTLLSIFETQGYIVVPEACQQIIAELNNELGMEEGIRELNGKPIFLDRGIPDYLAFLRLVDVEIPKYLWEIG